MVQTDGFINITTTGGTQVYTYDWTDQDGNTVTANDQGNLENIGAGTYTAVVTDENGCSDTVTVEITENEPVLSLNHYTLIMLDMVSVVKMKLMGLLILLLPVVQKHIHMTGQPRWTVTANDQGNLENIGAGTYTAVVTDENGC